MRETPAPGRPAPDAVLVVAARGEELDDVADLLRSLVALGHEVSLVARYGRFGAALGGLGSQHLSRPPVAEGEPAAAAEAVASASSRAARWIRRNGPSRAEQGAGGAAPGVERPALLSAFERDEHLLDLVRRSDRVVTVGSKATDAVSWLLAGHRPEVSTQGVRELAALNRAGVLAEAAAPVRDGAGPGIEALTRLCSALELAADHGCPEPDATEWSIVTDVVRLLSRSARRDEVLRVVRAGRRSVGRTSPRLTPAHRVVWAAGELTAAGSTDEDVAAVVAAALPAVDEAASRGDVDDVTDRLHDVLALLYHRELHADQPQTPLVDRPDEFLAPLHRSHVWTLLRAPQPRSGPGRPVGNDGAAPRVLVLPGSYPRFAAAVVRALEPQSDPVVLDTSSYRPGVGVGLSRDILRSRVAQVLGRDFEPDRVLLEAMAAADVVLVDWLDRTAVLAVMAAPPGVRLVLRVHSMDALSSWVPLLDWSRVDAVVFVSDHIRDVVTRQVQGALDDVDVHVIGNAVSPARFDRPKRPGAERTLGVVGWGQRVKDPMWALEVLGALRRDDPAWRLRLVGHDFAPGAIASARDYAESFRRRLVADDVCGAVDFVPFTDDVPGELTHVGYVLSSSVRESAPVGVTEGAASGAVPVVRDWPMFRSVGGARRRFPDDWVVDDVAAAVDRVRDVASRLQEESAAARRHVEHHLSEEQLADRYRSAVLGGRGRSD